jgi:hypothetical protein
VVAVDIFAAAAAAADDDDDVDVMVVVEHKADSSDNRCVSKNKTCAKDISTKLKYSALKRSLVWS